MRPRLARFTSVLSSFAVIAAAGACAKLARLESVVDDATSEDSSAAEADTTDDASPPPPPDANDDVFAPSPGLIPCGQTACRPRDRCCIEGDDIECKTQSQNCEGTEINCDEPADCGGASPTCCLTRDEATPAWSTFCVPMCPSFGAIVCKSDADCPSRRCVPITCGTVRLGTCDGAKPRECG